MTNLSLRLGRWAAALFAMVGLGRMSAQSAGDIAFVGFNADGVDGFAFVTMVDIPANTDIWFTDEEWNGTAFASLTSEGDVVWSNAVVTPAGTVVDVDGLSSTPIASLGSIVVGTNGGAGLSSSDEGIYVYLGTQRNPTTFITAITNSLWGGGGGSLTGTGLTAGVNAMEFGNAADVAAYTGPRIGQLTFAAYLPGIYDLTNNWIYGDGAGDQSIDGVAPDVPFNITPFSLGAGDVTPPIPTSATLSSATSVVVKFNEAIDPVTTAATGNYVFGPALAVSAATPTGSDSVILTVAPLTSGVAYQLDITGIEDTAGNAMTAIQSFTLIYNANQPNLVITEIMYNPPGDDSLEFVELYNAGTATEALGGLTFALGIDFTFPQVSLVPGATVLVAVDTAASSNFFGVPFTLQFGGALGNGGEALLLVNSVGDTIDYVVYDDASPWPLGTPSPDGDGPSIELLNPVLENNNGANWFASTTFQANDGAGTPVLATPGTVSMVTSASVSVAASTLDVEENAGSFNIVVNLNGVAGDTVKAKLVLTSLRTATPGQDATVGDTTMISFVPNQLNQSATITIPVADDAAAELDEYLSFRLMDITNASLSGSGTVIVYIHDNDRQAPAPSQSISLNLLTSYDNTPAPLDNSAEIVAYSPEVQRLFIANSLNNSLDIVDFSDPANPTAITSVDMSAIGDLTSVAVFDTMVAVSAANPNQQLNGTVTFFGASGVQLAQVTVGALPDMVTFTHDGQKVLTANEGQPSDDYTVDPEGSVSIIDISGGLAGLSAANVTTAGFAAFNGQTATLEADGVRISGLSNTTVAQDMEPEYVTISSDNTTAWVSCQENNALAVVDLLTNTVTSVQGLGSKDWSLMAGIDAEDQSGQVRISAYPFKGLYIPDAIASYEVAGVTYIVSANEGDAREYAALTDESRLGDGSYVLDSAAFPNGDILKGAVGRIKTFNNEGDLDGDGDFDEIVTLGGRSFSIWNGSTGDLVYDSGDDLELITSQSAAFAAIFNSNEDGTSAKNRSDDKGPEPEGVTTGVINGRTYAFITLERIGGVMVYDVTNPQAPEFVEYVNSKLTNNDFAPEGIIFISSENSPIGKPLVVVANEVSSTLSIFEVDGEITGEVEFARAAQTVSESAGTVLVELTLTDGTPDSTVTVEVVLGNFATADAGSDFTAMSTMTVSFAPGDTSATLSIPVADDNSAENDEYFSLRITDANNTFLGSRLAHTVYVLDNDRVADTGNKVISLAHVTSLQIGTQGDDAAEIVAYDETSEKLFVANSVGNSIEIVDFSTPATPVALAPIDVTTYGGVNSVAVFNGVVAAAIENDDKELPGKVVFFDNNGTFLSQVTVGALPDMITFSPDGTKVLTANEGEPNSDYSVDPEGSVSIVDISGGVSNVTQANVSTASFTSFNGQAAQLRAAGVRIFGPNATVAQDLEPEYIALSADGDTAWVTCQENNALAIVNVATATVIDIVPLGYKDHSLAGQGLDAEDRSGFVRIANYPVKGMYMPDAIASYRLNGKTYLVTANEGDAREYDTYAEEVRLSSSGYELDETVFPDGDLLKANIGRLTVTEATGDLDGDGDFDEVHVLGARSFSIWDGGNGNLIYDSGDQMELYLSQDPKWGPFFNSTNDELGAKNRSDNKGPEPEAVAIGNINGGFFAFVGLERIGGVMVYDITNPAAPEFVDYENTRDTASEGGDLAPEGIVLIPNSSSPDGKYYVVVANEVSSTLTVYEVEGVSVSNEKELASLPLSVYPNPAQDGVQVSVPGAAASLEVVLLTVDGREVLRQRAGDSFAPVSLSLEGLASGVYLIEVRSDLGRAVQRLIVQ